MAGSCGGLNVWADARSTYLADEICGREVGVSNIYTGRKYNGYLRFSIFVWMTCFEQTRLVYQNNKNHHSRENQRHTYGEFNGN